MVVIQKLIAVIS
ncbi:hypothetical protein FWK35_00036252 [Aphis craccivora]|uniref:Uncharacterized protein n=1 Tax=Aphis craccivora TaxID=307492 RepID=A0A6G0VNU4_APHCR|nr:hypothetical protein FWK35_00036252 [Aphis craccivora]